MKTTNADILRELDFTLQEFKDVLSIKDGELEELHERVTRLEKELVLLKTAYAELLGQTKL